MAAVQGAVGTRGVTHRGRRAKQESDAAGCGERRGGSGDHHHQQQQHHTRGAGGGQWCKGQAEGVAHNGYSDNGGGRALGLNKSQLQQVAGKGGGGAVIIIIITIIIIISSSSIVIIIGSSNIIITIII